MNIRRRLTNLEGAMNPTSPFNDPEYKPTEPTEGLADRISVARKAAIKNAQRRAKLPLKKLIAELEKEKRERLKMASQLESHPNLFLQRLGHAKRRSTKLITEEIAVLKSKLKGK